MVGLRLLPSEKAALKAAADEKDLAVPDLISMCLVKQGIKMMESNPHSSMPTDNNDRPVDHLEQLYRAALIAEAEDLAHGLHHLSIATGDPETDDDINRITQLAWCRMNQAHTEFRTRPQQPRVDESRASIDVDRVGDAAGGQRRQPAVGAGVYRSTKSSPADRPARLAPLHGIVGAIGSGCEGRCRQVRRGFRS